MRHGRRSKSELRLFLQSQKLVILRESGGSIFDISMEATMDSRVRGNDGVRISGMTELGFRANHIIKANRNS